MNTELNDFTGTSCMLFFGCELARTNTLHLHSKSHRNVNLSEQFTAIELARWERQAQELNLQGKGDQVGFWLSR